MSFDEIFDLAAGWRAYYNALNCKTFKMYVQCWLAFSSPVAPFENSTLLIYSVCSKIFDEIFDLTAGWRGTYNTGWFFASPMSFENSTPDDLVTVPLGLAI